jgi:hypothetical protein
MHLVADSLIGSIRPNAHVCREQSNVACRREAVIPGRDGGGRSWGMRSFPLQLKTDQVQKQQQKQTALTRSLNE